MEEDEQSHRPPPLHSSGESEEVDGGCGELRDWGPHSLTHLLLSRIPEKAQRGLSTLPLHITTLAASGDWMALGTNVGLIYLFNRRTDTLHRLKTKSGGSGISRLALISSPDVLVGGGSEDGQLAIFQLSLPSHQVIVFQLRDGSGGGGRVHSTRITSLEWSSNGLKLFSGDGRGNVALTNLDFDKGVGETRPLIQSGFGEKDGGGEGEIVGLSYLRQHLLISTTLQSLIFSLPTHSTARVGSQERKIGGRFGGVWAKKTSLVEPPTLYSVRPGGRLWVADIQGTVRHTIKFKDALMEGNHGLIPITTNSSPSNSTSSPRLLAPLNNNKGGGGVEFQLHSLHHWNWGCLVATGSISTTTPISGSGGRPLLLILDPVRSEILGICNELESGGILDLTVNLEGGGPEIFILQPHRHLIRLASHPDPFPITRATPTPTSSGGLQRIKREEQEGGERGGNYFLRNIPQLMSMDNAKQLMMSVGGVGDGGNLLDTPLAHLLSSTLKETSRRVAAPVHQTSTSIIQGLRQVFEGEVEDGIWIPLHPPPVHTHQHNSTHGTSSSGRSIVNENGDYPNNGTNLVEECHHEEEEDRRRWTLVEDRFGHISQLPFDEVLLTPITPPPIISNHKVGGPPSSSSSTPSRRMGRKAQTRKGKGRRRGKGAETGSTRDPTPDRSVLPTGAAAAAASLSNSTTSILSLVVGEEGAVKDSVIMSQSWSVGQAPSSQLKDVVGLEGDLESKEEILALKLNWPFLAPNSPPTYSSSSSAFIPPLTTPHLEENKSFLCKMEEEEVDPGGGGDNPGGGGDSTRCNLEEEEESLDIYTRYRDPTPPPSQPLSFGPPSSSTPTSLEGNPCLITTTPTPTQLVIPQIVEIEETELPSNSSSSSLTEQLDNHQVVDNAKDRSDVRWPLRDMIVEPLPLTPPPPSLSLSHNHQPEANEDCWLSIPAPGPVVSLTLTSHHSPSLLLLVVDRKKRVWAAQLSSPPVAPSSSSSSSLRWVGLSGGWRGDVLGLSPSGSLILRLLGSTLYYSPLDVNSFSNHLLVPSSKKRGGGVAPPTWTKLLEDVSSFSISGGDGGGGGVIWVVRGDGSLHYLLIPTSTNKSGGLGAVGSGGQFNPLSPPPPFPLARVVGGGSGGEEEKNGGGGRLWGLGLNGRLCCHPCPHPTGGGGVIREGTDWFTLSPSLLPTSSPITSLAILGSSLFLTDTQANLYFITQPPRGGGNSSSSYSSSILLWRVPMAQHVGGGGGSPPTTPTDGGEDYREGSATRSSFSLSGIKAKLRPMKEKLVVSSSSSSGNSGKILLLGGVGGSGLWLSPGGGSPTLYHNHTRLTGHRWETLEVSRPLTRKMSSGGVGGVRNGRSWWWVGLMGGSIYLDHGVLWLLDNNGKLFYSHPSGGEAKAIDLPTSCPLSCVVPAPDALWILSEDGVLWARDNLHTDNPIGHGWTTIDLSSQERLHLVHVSCGSDVAWACDTVGRVYFRSGSLRPPAAPQDMSPPWVQVEPNDPPPPPPPLLSGRSRSPSLATPIFIRVYVGTNGSMVWALDSSYRVWVREAVFPDFPIGTRWLLVPGLHATSLALSESGVWALSLPPPTKSDGGGSTIIYRRVGISKNNFVGDFWREIPSPSGSGGRDGGLVGLTSSLCDQMWGLDGSGWIGKHVSTTIKFKPPPPSPCSGPPPPRTVLDPEDGDDWELIDSLDLA